MDTGSELERARAALVSARVREERTRQELDTVRHTLDRTEAELRKLKMERIAIKNDLAVISNRHFLKEFIAQQNLVEKNKEVSQACPTAVWETNSWSVGPNFSRVIPLAVPAGARAEEYVPEQAHDDHGTRA